MLKNNYYINCIVYCHIKMLKLLKIKIIYKIIKIA